MGCTTGVRFLALQMIIPFATASRPAVGPTRPPVQWVPGVKRPGPEGADSSHSSGEVKEFVKLYLHSPMRFHGVVLS
jgi:hypothetical protein